MTSKAIAEMFSPELEEVERMLEGGE